MFKRISIVLVMLAFGCGAYTPVCAGDDESLSQKAASQLVDSLPDFVKDVTAMRTMTPQQKLEFIMNNVDSRVQEKVGEKFKDQIKDKVKEYTQAAVRARAFQEIGIPQIRNAFVMGQAIDWAKIDTQLASSVDTKMRAFDAGWKAAEIGWGAYEAYASGDALAAAKSISGSVCDLLAEAYIPGWGWVKFGAQMVEALGNYVLSYATDTAVQGMLENLYGMKSNPQGLADWLIKKSPQDIMADINDKWNDGMSFGYLWQGQGTDKGDEEMKSRVQSALVSLRGELLAKIKEEERKEKELEQFMQKYKDDAEKKATELQAVAKQAKEQVDLILGPVKAFRAKYYGLRKQEVKTQEAQIQTQMSGGGGIAYSPLNRGSIVGIYQNALMEVRDGPSNAGFDKDAYDRLYEEFSKKYREETVRHTKANEDAIQGAGKAMWDAWGPQFDALTAAESAAYKRGDDKAIAAIRHQFEALNDRFSPVQAAFGKAVQETRKKMAADRQLLDKEIELAGIEASERGLQFGTRMRQTYQSINEKLAAANAEFGTGMQLVRQMVAKLNFPGLWRYNSTGAGILGGGYSGPARQLKDGSYEFITGPGHLSGAMATAEEELRKVKDDLSYLSQIDALERKTYASYRQVVTNAFSDFKAATPERIRVVHKPAIFSADQGDNLNNSLSWSARSGNPAGFGEEVWACSGFNYISFPGGYLPIKGVVIPLEFLNQVDVLLGNPAEPYQKAIKQVEDDITAMRGWAEVDELGVMINQLGPVLSKIFDQFAYRGEGIPNIISQFRVVHDGTAVLLDATTIQESAGYIYLQAMKKTWVQYGYRVEKIANLAKGYGKGHKYQRDDPKKFIDKIPSWQNIPAKIKVYEAAMEQSIKDSNKSCDDARKQLKDLKDQFKKLLGESGATTLKSMQNIQSTVKLIVQHNLAPDLASNGFSIIKDDLLKFQKEVDTGIETWLAEQKKRSQEYQRQQEIEQQAAQAEAAKKKQEERQRNIEQLSANQRAGLYGFSILDPRLNTVSLNNARGTVVVTRNDLKQGALEVTLRMHSIDQAKTILFSEDDARTWQEVPLSRDIRYTFTPLPGKRYLPTIKVKTLDGYDIVLKVFNTIDAVVYQDIDYQQQIAEAVKTLADSYERKDLATFSRLISRDFIGNKVFLEEGVRLDFDLFNDIKLSIYINRIEKRSSEFVADTKWDKSQLPRKTGQQQRTSGSTTFLFVLEDGEMKIKNLRGNLIYATLSPEIAQSSGLPTTTVDQIRTAQQERNPIQPGAGQTEDAGGVTDAASAAVTRSITVTSPNGGENWAQSSSHAITWNSTGVSNVQIQYRNDFGAWEDVVASTSAGSGSYNWNLPPIPGVSQIKIIDLDDATVSDLSDATFTIT